MTYKLLSRFIIIIMKSKIYVLFNPDRESVREKRYDASQLSCFPGHFVTALLDSEPGL